MYNQMMSKYYNMNQQEITQREVFAVAAGANVTFSSCHNPEHVNYPLDYNGPPPQAWCAKKLEKGEWIQVSQESPRLWRGIIIQGRGDMEQWVTNVKFAYTVNGKGWDGVDGGKVFQCDDTNMTNKEFILFEKPVYARAIRIYP